MTARARAAVILAAFGCVLIAAVQSPAGERADGGYRYDGIHSCLATASLKLKAYNVGSGHAAVWSGVASAGRQAWLQAGIAVFAGAGPSIYVEIKRPAAEPRYIELGPATSLLVRLSQTGDRWTLRAAGHSYHVHIDTPQCFAGVESWDLSSFNSVSGAVRNGTAVLAFSLSGK